MIGLVALGLGLAAAYGLRATGHWGGRQADAFFVSWVYDAVAAIGTVLCAWRSIRVREDRWTWGLIAVAFVLDVVGNTIYVAPHGASNGPVPSVADVFWLGLYLPMGAVLTLRLHAAGRIAGVVVLDILIATCTLAAVSAAFVLESVIGRGAGSTYVVTLAYPVADVVLASLVLQLAAAGGWRLGRATAVVAGCIVVWALTDTAYAVEVIHGTYVGGGLLDLGWVGPFALLGAAAWLPADRPRAAARPSGWRSVAVPVGSAICALVMLVYSGLAQLSPAVVGLAASALVGVIARLALTFRSYLVALGETRLVLEHAYDPFMSFDAAGRVTEWNPAAQASFGWSRDEVVGRDMAEMFLPEGRREPQRRHIARFLETGEDDVLGRRIERSVLHRDGHEVPIELTVSAHQTEYGCSFHAFLRDISRRREIERTKDEFVSIVSHELRTPLSSIRGSLGLLASGVLAQSPAKADRMVQIALENTDRLVRLINDMLDIERIESAAVKLDCRACEAGALVDQAADAMRVAATLAGVSIEIVGASGALWADPDRIAQTLTNLISNAIKFSSRGGTMWLGAYTRDDEVVFEVRDEGRGIPPDKLESIFERFEQVDSSDAREKGGTGLGLAICRSIIDQHGGRIWAESSLGQGSTFRFALPGAGARGSAGAQALAGAVDHGG